MNTLYPSSPVIVPYETMQAGNVVVTDAGAEVEGKGMRGISGVPPRGEVCFAREHRGFCAAVRQADEDVCLPEDPESFHLAPLLQRRHLFP